MNDNHTRSKGEYQMPPSGDRGLFIFFGLMFIIPVLAFFAFSIYIDNKPMLDYFGPKNEKGEEHTVPFFLFTDQTGREVSSDEMKGKVYVANFFFTSCPKVCPLMFTRMKEVEKAFGEREDFKILSFTVDPVRDTVEKLKAYSEKFEINNNSWHLLTGKKEDIYLLARNGYFITAIEGDGGPKDFIHSEKFVLIDGDGHVRGYYTGTEEDEVERLVRDIGKLSDGSRQWQQAVE